MRSAYQQLVITAVLILSWVSFAAGGTSPSDTAMVTTETEDLIRELLQRADSLSQLKQVDTAMVLSRLVLEKAAEVYGESDSTVAHAMSTLGECYYYKGDFAEAESLMLRGLKIRETLLGPDHVDVAESKNNIAVLYLDMGKYTESERYFEQSLSIWENASDDYDIDVAKNLANQTGLYVKLGRYSKAEKLCLRSLDIKENILEPSDIGLGISFNNLATTYRYQGRYVEAQSYQIKAKTIWEKAPISDNWYVGLALHNQAMIFKDQKKHTEADSFFVLAQDNFEKTLGSEHPYLATCLNNRGQNYTELGSYSKADKLINRALSINKNVLGPEHPSTGENLHYLAYNYICQERYHEAETLLKQALTIWENSYGPEHPYLAESLKSLARIYYSLGEFDKCLRTYIKFFESRQDFINYVFASASEGQKMRYIDRYPLIENSFLSFALKNNTAKSRQKALEMILRGKAVVFDAVSAEKRIVSCSYDIVQLAERHSLLSGELSALILAGPGRMKQDMYRARIQTLKHTIGLLENDMRTSCSEMKDRLDSKKYTVTDVSDVLPGDSMLWEFIKYRPYRFDTPGSDTDRTGQPRYLAFTLDTRGNITLTDLGDAAEIDSLVSIARKLIYDARRIVYSPLMVQSERKLAEVTGALYTMIFAPLETNLHEGKNIFVSPDGQLNLLPFEILPTPDGKYVIEKYRISYLSSGRDLIRFQKVEKQSDWALVMADPDFNTHQKGLSGRDNKSYHDSEDVVSFIDGRTRGVNECLTEPFSPLPKTRKESQSITRTLKKKAKLKISSYYGADAREKILKEISQAPKVLHLSTHGYFCKDLDFTSNRLLENPLLRSGLAMAGANRLKDEGEEELRREGEDGILTAYEVSGLNLTGTELATLSACETGVGEIKTGEGVFSLRRAFQSAGARSVLMSLWKVPDEETTELMDQFYKNWLEGGMTKQEALRQSSLKILNSLRERYGVAHPFLWGGFALAGNPN